MQFAMRYPQVFIRQSHIFLDTIRNTWDVCFASPVLSMSTAKHELRPH